MLGGIGVMDIMSTASGAYYASTLACLPVIAKVYLAQSLGLNPVLFNRFTSPHKPIGALFNRNGSPHPTNQ